MNIYVICFLVIAAAAIGYYEYSSSQQPQKGIYVDVQQKPDPMPTASPGDSPLVTPKDKDHHAMNDAFKPSGTK